MHQKQTALIPWNILFFWKQQYAPDEDRRRVDFNSRGKNQVLKLKHLPENSVHTAHGHILLIFERNYNKVSILFVNFSFERRQLYM